MRRNRARTTTKTITPSRPPTISPDRDEEPDRRRAGPARPRRRVPRAAGLRILELRLRRTAPSRRRASSGSRRFRGSRARSRRSGASTPSAGLRVEGDLERDVLRVRVVQLPAHLRDGVAAVRDDRDLAARPVRARDALVEVGGRDRPGVVDVPAVDGGLDEPRGDGPHLLCSAGVKASGLGAGGTTCGLPASKRCGTVCPVLPTKDDDQRHAARDCEAAHRPSPPAGGSGWRRACSSTRRIRLPAPGISSTDWWGSSGARAAPTS